MSLIQFITSIYTTKFLSLSFVNEVSLACLSVRVTVATD